MYDVGGGRVERVLGVQGSGGPLKSLEAFSVSPGAVSGEVGSSSLLAFMGDQGTIPLVSLHSRRTVGVLKMAGGSARCAAFVPALGGGGTSDTLLSLGSDGVVHTWDLRMRRCVSQLSDFGNTQPTAMAVSPNGQLLATGSGAGVVNVYRASTGGTFSAAGGSTLGSTGGTGGTRKQAALGAGAVAGVPAREVMNLTTAVDHLTFSHDSQVW